MSGEDLELPEAHAIEQEQVLSGEVAEEPELSGTDLPLEADEADFAEQTAELDPGDEDDYR